MFKLLYALLSAFGISRTILRKDLHKLFKIFLYMLLRLFSHVCSYNKVAFKNNHLFTWKKVSCCHTCIYSSEVYKMNTNIWLFDHDIGKILEMIYYKELHLINMVDWNTDLNLIKLIQNCSSRFLCMISLNYMFYSNTKKFTTIIDEFFFQEKDHLSV